jgi:hypothetical protein
MRAVHPVMPVPLSPACTTYSISISRYPIGRGGDGARYGHAAYLPCPSRHGLPGASAVASACPAGAGGCPWAVRAGRRGPAAVGAGGCWRVPGRWPAAVRAGGCCRARWQMLADAGWQVLVRARRVLAGARQVAGCRARRPAGGRPVAIESRATRATARDSYATPIYGIARRMSEKDPGSGSKTATKRTYGVRFLA